MLGLVFVGTVLALFVTVVSVLDEDFFMHRESVRVVIVNSLVAALAIMLILVVLALLSLQPDKTPLIMILWVAGILTLNVLGDSTDAIDGTLVDAVSALFVFSLMFTIIFTGSMAPYFYEQEVKLGLLALGTLILGMKSFYAYFVSHESEAPITFCVMGIVPLAAYFGIRNI